MIAFKALGSGGARLFVCLAFAAATAQPALAQHWSRSWAVAPQGALETSTTRPAPELAGKTLRQVVRLSSGGKAIRLNLSNEMSDAPLRIAAVRVALADKEGRIVPGSDRPVPFGGQAEVTIPDHAPMLSDPIAMKVTPLTRLAVSMYFAAPVVQPTVHSYSAATGWLAAGDQAASPVLTGVTHFDQRLILKGVDVESPQAQPTVVAFGDSITDGVRATTDADTRWPDQLAARLVKAGKAVSVANMGISGNRLLKDGTGPNALARFDRDVLSVPGATHVIILEGVNDIGAAARDKDNAPPTVGTIVAAYRQMIARGHQRGLKVILATILPYKGAGYWSAEGEVTRQGVNKWIKESGEADGVADFDAAIADKNDPARMAAAYDCGDHLHPNDAGFTVMSDAVPLRALR
ncbi:SGNH/GDSL hydrolase family protein [Sphingobium sp. H39-3-25]|uniref:SGNH/GDSL hydrolase family protein n=1 Tax=Sphingobium arseniciresistens TaxID=3030834 RepID=UPI0023B8D2AD|nr:SGNH/GDSL hydrolase family protein [Sphingobium arseniciresistens]